VSHFLVDHMTVSSAVLARSFSAAASPVSHIPDCIDVRPGSPPPEPPEPELSYPHRSPTGEHERLPPLHLLWYGGAARPGSQAGIEELYAATAVLRDLASRVRLRLSVCTRFEADTMPIFREWASRSDFMEIAYFPWSLPAQEFLLQACDVCFLPRLQSLATFYKSPNRLVLAAHHGRRTLTNLIPSEEVADLAPLLPADLLAALGESASWGDARAAVPVPATWTVPSIVSQWRQVIRAAEARCRRKPRPPLPERIGMRLLLLLLRTTMAVSEGGKSFRKSLRKRKPLRRLRSRLTG
jgi:hypothetical protein